MRSACTRILSALALFALVACGGPPPTDALDAAREAVESSELAERCAEAEFRAARNLLERANEAYEARDYDRARQLAEAARQQAERAEQIAEENREDCEREEEVVAAVEELQEREERPPPPTDHDWQPVYFDYDAATLSAEARAVLEGHAGALAAEPDVRLRIEGHCDQRGTMEYNFALGERRARAVRDYLIRLGVDPNRMRTISYGAEMLVDEDFSANRRAEFEVR